VPRFYIDVWQNGEVISDDDGYDFESLDAAVHAGARSAAEIGTSRLVRGDTSDVVIQVRDELSQQVCTVTASMKIDQHASSDQEPSNPSVMEREHLQSEAATILVRGAD
jgi:hypothetical protein